MSYKRSKSATEKVDEPVQRSREPNVTQDRLQDAWVWSASQRRHPAVRGNASAAKPKDRLHHPGLSLADDAPTPTSKVKLNSQGTKKGYDPYDSGRLGGTAKSQKKDLRKLGEWLNLRKQAVKNKSGVE